MLKPRVLGIPPSIQTKPLSEPLRGNASFQLLEESRPSIAARLRQHELSAALLSPLDYARASSEYCIVPNVAVVSTEGGAIIRFRDGVKRIHTLAADPQFACEIVLAKIILSESFNIEPKILPTNIPAEMMLESVDAALLVGDSALRDQSENIIDVVEEWFELTGTPFVHALWCGRKDSLTGKDIELMQRAQATGIACTGEILTHYPKAERDALHRYLQSFTYALDEQDREGLVEFMKYLYYHGVLPDVAELNFFSTGDVKDDVLSDFSPN